MTTSTASRAAPRAAVLVVGAPAGGRPVGSGPMTEGDRIWPDRSWEASVMARVAAGDDSALGMIYDQYSSLVYGIAARLVGTTRASDVTQEVFIRLWERPEGFDSTRGSLRTYVTVMARRRSIDALRRHGRVVAREERVARHDPRVAAHVDEAAMALIDADRVRAAVASLPAEQRRCIELAYFEGLSYREVATAMGAPEGTTKSRLRLALARLAASLDDEGVVEWA